MVTARAIYLCYFPLHEPLVQTQVLPYLRALVAGGVEVTLLTFEPADGGGAAGDDATATTTATAERLHGEGIDWQRRRYHKRPSLPATLVDIAVGAWFVRRRVRQGAVDVLHARSHVPAVMAVLGRGRRRHPRFLFDVRGFMPEEYVDAGLWRAGGTLFRGMKAVERALLRRADALVVLTERAKAVLARSAAPSAPVAVVPCCVDLAAFPRPTAEAKEAAKRGLGVEGRPVVLYVGSTIGFYLFDDMVRFAVAARRRRPSTFFLVLTQRDVAGVARRIAAAGLSPDQFSVRSVAPGDIPGHAVAADMALSFVPATYSKQASSPTKVAEYLACGVPVVATAGVGDIDTQLADEDVGVLLRSLDDGAFDDALDRLERVTSAPDVAERCRAAATRLFDLHTVGGPRYVGLYRELLRAPRPAMA